MVRAPGFTRPSTEGPPGCPQFQMLMKRSGPHLPVGWLSPTGLRSGTSGGSSGCCADASNPPRSECPHGPRPRGPETSPPLVSLARLHPADTDGQAPQAAADARSRTACWTCRGGGGRGLPPRPPSSRSKSPPTSSVHGTSFGLFQGRLLATQPLCPGPVYFMDVHLLPPVPASLRVRVPRGVKHFLGVCMACSLERLHSSCSLVAEILI